MLSRTLLIFLTFRLLCAQSITGSITGNVLDPTDLAVTGARVTLRQAATGAARETLTDATGRFFFGSLQPGQYDLVIEAPGFKRLERRAIRLTAAETLGAGDLRLEVGAVSESVFVTAQGATVQTQSAERAGVLTGTQVESLAIRGRNVMSLLSLLPGVVDIGEPEQLSNGWNLNVNGGRRDTNNVSLDGATLNAIGNQFNSVVNVSMDAIAEVKVLLTNYQAEHGRLSGANVHMVTKSGTREFHGLGSYFKRHEQFNANEFFNNYSGLPKARYRFNVWNYNIGGPVYLPGRFNVNRDRLFFFWSQEFWPLTVPQPLTRRTVPAELERQGDFSRSLDVNNRLIVIRDPTTGQPFAGNLIPRPRIDANGQALLKVFPLPNFLDRGVSGGNYNYIFQDEQSTPLRTETLKLDYHLRPSDILTFNYTHRRDEQEGSFNVSGGGTNYDQLRQTSLNEGRIYILRYQRIFRPTLINETNSSYSNRPWNNTIRPDDLRHNQRSQAGFTLGQFNPRNNPLDFVPNTVFGGVPNDARTNLDSRTPLTTTHEIFTFSNNLTKTFSGHTLKAGFYFDRIWADNQATAGAFNGAFDFSRNVNNPLDTNYAYSNAALGVFNSYTELTERPFPTARVSNIEWFVQDNWRVSPRLTLDFGMRFYLLPHSFIDGDRISGFLAARYNPAKAVRLIEPAIVNNQRVGRHPGTGQILPASLIGAIASGAGDPGNGMISHVLDPAIPGALMEDRGVHLGPRAGFAWNVFGNSKTAIRGGFGLFYTRMSQGNVLYSYTIQTPFVQSPTVFFSTMPTLLSSTGYLFPTNVLGLDLQGKVPTVMNYSLSIQQDVGFSTVVDIGYVGSLGRHLLWARNLNAIPFGANFDPRNLDPTTGRPLPPAFLRTYAGYNTVEMREPGATSNYHSLQVTANRRFARGLEFGGSWTWSKAMDFVDGDTGVVSTLIPVRVWNYGLAGFDRTHVLKLNWLYDLPNRAWPSRIVRFSLNNWQWSGIVTFSSGQPFGVGFSTTTGIDITGSPTDGARIVVTGNPVLPKSERTFDRFFNTSVFRLPAVGTAGNAAKTLIRGPGINNFDLAFYKNFPIRESIRLQFRGELYNAFNHSQFDGVDNGARFDPQGIQVNQRFGQITSARPARRIQLALRFYF
ncbi:MAG: TonB-dependent receptor [Acidobacteria bacterium]|nr:TonB-dependent receptor [Acidobacteriota bacterium]